MWYLNIADMHAAPSLMTGSSDELKIKSAAPGQVKRVNLHLVMVVVQ
jgi:hypothetical protein